MAGLPLRRVGRAVLLLVPMWWMYGGHAWLTDAAPPVTTVRRVLLLLDMTGSLVMAPAVPGATVAILLIERARHTSPVASRPAR